MRARRTRRPAAAAARPDRPGARSRWCRAGWPSVTSQRTLPRSGSTPSSCAPWPTSNVSLYGGQHARLRQRQRIAGALQAPQRPAIERIERADHAVDAHHEDTLAGHQRRGGDARVQALAPEFAAALEHHDLVVARDHRGEAAVAADAGQQRRAGVGAPALGAAGGVQRSHRAVAARPPRTCRRAPARPAGTSRGRAWHSRPCAPATAVRWSPAASAWASRWRRPPAASTLRAAACRPTPCLIATPRSAAARPRPPARPPAR